MPPETSPELHRPQVTLKTVFTVCGGTLLVAAAVLAAIKSLVAIGLTVAALLLAVALDHLVGRLTRRGWPRGLGVATVIVGVLAGLAGVGALVIPIGVGQARQFIQAVPRMVPAVQNAPIVRTLERHLGVQTMTTQEVERAAARLIGGVGPVLSVLGSALAVVAGAVTVLFLTVFILIFGGSIVRAILAEARPERRVLYGRVLGKIYDSIGGYLGGLVMICSANATVTTAFLWLNHVPFPLPLGFLSGCSSAIPYAGPAVTGTFITVVAAATGGLWRGVGTALYFLAYGQIEGNVLSPLVFRRTVHLNPLIVTLAILFLGEMAGVPGAIVAVPAVATLQVIVREILRVRREQLDRLREQVVKPAPAV
jgi:predicted PurR-regulated permease PerM